jgi:uncharacterized membrane protein
MVTPMQFSPGSAIRYGWETFKQRPWFFVGATFIIAILYAVAGGIGSGIDSLFGGSAEQPTIAGSIVNYALGALISMGVTAFYLAAHDNPEAAEFSMLWHPQPFWKFLGTSILVTLAIIVGFVLLIVPGIIAMLFFMFSTLLVIDRGLGPVEAMKESMRITAGYRWPLLGLVCLLLLILLAGALALMVGLLIAMPVTTVAFVHAYRVLSGRTGQATPVNARLAA